MKEIRKFLLSLQDEEYKRFSCLLMPTMNPDPVIGIRTPIFRKYAKELAEEGKAKLVLSSSPHIYYEENNLHAFLIEKIGGVCETAKNPKLRSVKQFGF